jgi:hypothetical protein
MMMTRRDAVASFALFAELFAFGRHADAQTQAGPLHHLLSRRCSSTTCRI